jgi:hypothetical protein
VRRIVTKRQFKLRIFGKWRAFSACSVWRFKARTITGEDIAYPVNPLLCTGVGPRSKGLAALALATILMVIPNRISIHI